MLVTLEQKNNLAKYLTEVYKIPVLTEEEEMEYAKKKEEGDLNAAKILISSHLRLVVKIAFKYQNYGLPIMDMISEGNIGLMKAVRDFTLEKGCRLATYAMWWIRAYIQDFILKSWSLVKIGTTTAQKKLFFNLNKIKNKILSYGQKDLNNENIKYISDTLSVSEDEVKDMNNRLYKKDISLNQKSKNNNEDNKEIKIRLDKLETRLDNVENRLEKLEYRLDKVENRIDSLENRITGLENRMDKLEAGQTEIKQRLDSMEKRLENLEAGQKFLADNIFQEDGIINYFEGKFNALNARFDDLEAKFYILNNRQFDTDAKVTKLTLVK